MPPPGPFAYTYSCQVPCWQVQSVLWVGNVHDMLFRHVAPSFHASELSGRYRSPSNTIVPRDQPVVTTEVWIVVPTASNRMENSGPLDLGASAVELTDAAAALAPPRLTPRAKEHIANIAVRRLLGRRRRVVGDLLMALLLLCRRGGSCPGRLHRKCGRSCCRFVDGASAVARQGSFATLCLVMGSGLRVPVEVRAGRSDQVTALRAAGQPRPRPAVRHAAADGRRRRTTTGRRCTRTWRTASVLTTPRMLFAEDGSVVGRATWSDQENVVGSLRSRTMISASSSAASRRRVRPATSRGRTVANSALACRADRNRGAPRGMSCRSRR
jgi:hypothetical protein